MLDWLPSSDLMCECEEPVVRGVRSSVMSLRDGMWIELSGTGDEASKAPSTGGEGTGE